MLHLGATEDSENESAGPTATASSAVPDMTLTRQEIARFNQRNSGRRRTPWQVIEDAPLLLRRLWCDVRAGDTRIFGEMIRRGVQLQLAVAALYIISPVRAETASAYHPRLRAHHGAVFCDSKLVY